MAHEEENHDSLYKWCREGNYEQISEFVKTCEDLPVQLAYHQKVSGYTALHEAANSGHLDILELLFHHGAYINCLSANNSTPLHLAVSRSHIDCALLLVAYGADDDIVDFNGKTAFQTAKIGSINSLIKSKGKPFTNCMW